MHSSMVLMIVLSTVRALVRMITVVSLFLCRPSLRVRVKRVHACIHAAKPLKRKEFARAWAFKAHESRIVDIHAQLADNVAKKSRH